MPNYSKQWSTATPGFLIFLIDQSNSMSQTWTDGKSFAQFTADVINRTVNELIATNAAGETVKNRVFISLIGYGVNGIQDIRSGYLSTYADNPNKVEISVKKVSDGAGGYIDMEIETPIFIEPVAGGYTPMSGAFELAKRLIESWIYKKNTHPVPVIINVSDGHPEASSKEKTIVETEKTILIAKEIMNIETPDGNPLIFNVHIAKTGTEIQFPETEGELMEDKYAKILFQISSRVPEVYKKAAKDLKLKNIGYNSKGFISNASPETLIKFINFGSSGGADRSNF